MTPQEFQTKHGDAELNAALEWVKGQFGTTTELLKRRSDFLAWLNAPVSPDLAPLRHLAKFMNRVLESNPSKKLLTSALEEWHEGVNLPQTVLALLDRIQELEKELAVEQLYANHPNCGDICNRCGEDWPCTALNQGDNQ